MPDLFIGEGYIGEGYVGSGDGFDGLATASVSVPIVPQRASLGLLTLAVSLLTSTLAPAQAATPFRQADWPVPAARAKQLLVTTSTRPVEDATRPIKPIAWVLADAKSRPPAWAPPNLLSSTLAPVVAASPFHQDDWPTPAARAWPVALRMHLDALKPLLAGQDQFFGAPGQGPSSDWRIPSASRQAPPWTPPNLLHSTLAPVVGQAPFAQAEWAIPRRGTGTLLVTTETKPAIVGPAPFSQSDWPRPVSRPVASGLTTWTHPRPAFYQEPAAGPAPFTQADWPLPARARLLPVTARQHLGYYTFHTSAPFAGVTPENPRVRAYPPVVAWTHRLHLGLVPAANPIPAGKSATIVPLAVPALGTLQTWTFSLLHSTLAPPPQLFGHTEWVVPQRTMQWHGWASQSLVQSTLAPAAGPAPFSQLDWSLPRRSTGTLLVTVSIRPATTPVAPLVPIAWDNPRHRPPSAIDLRTWLQTLTTSTLSLAPDVLRAGRAQTVVPDARGTLATLRTWTLSLLQSTLAPAVVQAPFSASKWPIPSRARPLPVTARQHIAYFVFHTSAPFAGVTPENPRVRAYPPVVAWTHRLHLGLVPAANPIPAGKSATIVPLAVPALGTLQTWTFSLLHSTLAPPPQLFGHTEWVVPQRTMQWHGLTTWVQGRPFFYEDEQPFRQTYWPPGVAAPPLRTLVSWAEHRLQGPLSLPLDELPNGRGALDLPSIGRGSVTLQTWFLSLNTTTLAPPVTAVPFAQTAWDVPQRSRALPVTARQIIGYFVFDTSAPFRGVTPENPRVARPAVSLSTWTVSLQTTTLVPPVITKPFALYDWPLPSRRVESSQPWTWADWRKPYQQDVVPAHQTDWFAGRAVQPLRTILGWTVTQSVLAPPAEPFSQTHWVVPVGLRRLDQRMVSEGQPLALTVIRPFETLEWRIPEARTALVTLWTWSKSRDAVLVDASPFSQYQWPLPLVPPRLHTLTTWATPPYLDSTIPPDVIHVTSEASRQSRLTLEASQATTLESDSGTMTRLTTEASE